MFFPKIFVPKLLRIVDLQRFNSHWFPHFSGYNYGWRLCTLRVLNQNVNSQHQAGTTAQILRSDGIGEVSLLGDGMTQR